MTDRAAENEDQLGSPCPPAGESLISLIDGGREGKVVLAHVQSSFIRDRESIEELLVSILNDVPGSCT